nr:MAG TPA: hypothetical protein [Microviridae sp.]
MRGYKGAYAPLYCTRKLETFSAVRALFIYERLTPW